MEYDQVTEFYCAIEGCPNGTSNWYPEGWMVTGLDDAMATSDSYRDDRPREPFYTCSLARQMLEASGAIEKNGLAAALICPDHKDGIMVRADALREEHRQEHSKFDDGECRFCRRESYLARMVPRDYLAGT
jgi:hypothetical protein